MLALCVATLAFAHTSTVSAIVIDDRTEQPIKGVSIYAENQSNGQLIRFEPVGFGLY